MTFESFMGWNSEMTDAFTVIPTGFAGVCISNGWLFIISLYLNGFLSSWNMAISIYLLDALSILNECMHLCGFLSQLLSISISISLPHFSRTLFGSVCRSHCGHKHFYRIIKKHLNAIYSGFANAIDEQKNCFVWLISISNSLSLSNEPIYKHA